MYESPQMRRLRSDLAAMERLQAESSVLQFRAYGKPAQRFLIEFRGKSLSREKGKVGLREHHEVEVKLGASYPRSMPELRWLTPIYHPNISEIGLVCLGGYGTHWVPSLHLDELCVMLWDMARYYNYDIRSPYNREAALWAANQTTFAFPTDPRPLRDRRVALGRIEEPRPGSGEPYPALKAPLIAAPGPPAATQPEAPKAPDRKAEEPVEICILDLEVTLPPPSRPPASPTTEEILFIE
jgi:ubiquitin-protein ligase